MIKKFGKWVTSLLMTNSLPKELGENHKTHLKFGAPVVSLEQLKLDLSNIVQR